MTAPQIDDFDLPGIQAPERQTGRWPEAAKMAVAGGAGCSLIVLLQFVLIWVIVQGLFSATVPEGLAVRLKSPPQAVQGQAMPLSLVIRNEGDQVFTVRSLTVRGATRRRFTLSELQPAPIAPKISLFGTDTWTFSQGVSPGKSWTLQLRATPHEIGKLRGVLEVQVDRGVRRVPIQVEVTSAPQKPAARETDPAKKRAE